jgi:hypothetical protein
MTCGSCKHEAVRNDVPCSGCSHGRHWEEKPAPAEALQPVKERPILFSAPMVRALLAGTKTQTRRAVKDKVPAKYNRLGWSSQAGGPVIPLSFCPYGQPGDRLWVRETFAIVPRTAYRCSEGVQQTLNQNDPYEHDAAIYREGWTRSKGGFRWRPSIFMPRWASRITLEITAVRVERLHDISREDAIAEGVRPLDGSNGPNYWTVDVGDVHLNNPTAQGAYSMLWDWINGTGSWAANPWVWVIAFRRINP